MRFSLAIAVLVAVAAQGFCASIFQPIKSTQEILSGIGQLAHGFPHVPKFQPPKFRPLPIRPFPEDSDEDSEEASPAAPVEPAAPSAPAVPAEPVAAAEPAAPEEPAAPSEVEEPSEPAE